MALSPFQRQLCRVLARSRVGAPEAAGSDAPSGAPMPSEEGHLSVSYVAGGGALNETLKSPRLSRDVDLFHDTLEALDATWNSDRALLLQEGYTVETIRERPGFVEAEVWRERNTVRESVLVQWVRDSAFRFFPLQPHPDFGLTLHPLDLATNKVLALVGRVEVRDWVDALTCHHKVVPLGLLAWTACGKDEGWNPQLILDEAARNSRASREEMEEIEWEGAPPDSALLKQQWRQALATARETIRLLPPEEIGKAVLQAEGQLFRGDNTSLMDELEAGHLHFHEGHIGGAWPQLKL